MIGNSRRISSNADGPDPRLQELIERYRSSQYQKPLAGHTVEAVDWLSDQIDLNTTDIVLDTGCGTGQSTEHLANSQANQHTVFLGVDQSAARLNSHKWQAPGFRKGQVILLRAELSDFWRLLQERKVKVRKHYFLYPNPWPKPSQLQRRWHAHPAFASALALGGIIELRTNWAAYAEEFAAALRLYGLGPANAEKIQPQCPVSPFEKKYLASGHLLYGVCLPDQTSCNN
ncbi:MAG: hypothetical protein AB8B96_22345 [Lysobacterales bacterium]